MLVEQKQLNPCENEVHISLINKFNQIMDGDYSDNIGNKYTDYAKTIKRFENIHRLLKQNNLEEPGNE